MSKKKYAAILFGLLATVLLTIMIGRVWFGWGYISDNEELLDSLPVPPGAQRISVGSSSYKFDESIMTPPEGWDTEATYQAPPEASREDIANFYISKLSPEWRYCVEDTPILNISTGEEKTRVMGSAHFFIKGSALVVIGTLNMLSDGPHTFLSDGTHTFGIAVDHKRVREFGVGVCVD